MDKIYSPEVVIYREEERENLYHICENKKIQYNKELEHYVNSTRTHLAH